jgi:hypothetical protein
VQCVAAAVRDEVADDRMPDQRHVADHVQNLLSFRLVRNPSRNDSEKGGWTGTKWHRCKDIWITLLGLKMR